MSQSTKTVVICGYEVTLDADSDAHVSPWAWCKIFDENGNGPYFASGSGKSRFYLHRVIAGCAPGELADHRDGNTLNNTRANLRRCTRSQNAANARKRDGANPYKGVFLDGVRWRVRLMHRKRNIDGGRFDDPELAARRYDQLAREIWGEFACVNFPLVGERCALPGANF